MRKVTMVRLGIAAAVATIGAVGALASGCTSDDSTGNPINNTDGGQNNPDGSQPVGDDDAGDGGTILTDSGPKPDAAIAPDAKLIIVHAAPGLGPVRLCFATSNAGGTPSVTAISALPDSKASAPQYAPPPAWGAYYDGGTSPVAPGTPGIYPGTIGAFPDITSLANLTITPYLIDANLIANNTSTGGPDGGAELDCQHIIGQHGQGTTDPGVKGILTTDQFITLDPVPSKTLLDGQTFLLSLTGCSGSYTLPAAASQTGVTLNDVCGPDFADAGAKGNISVGIAPIDTSTAPADGGWGVQFAHRSTMLEGSPVLIAQGPPPVFHAPASGGLAPLFVTETAETFPVDGGTDDAGNPVDGGTTTVTVPGIVPVGAPVKTSNSQITALASVSVNPTTSSFGVATTPGSQTDAGVVYLPWPASLQTANNEQGLLPGDLIAVPLPVVNQLSAWNASVAPDSGAPANFAPGTAFTFVILGSAFDPQLSNPDGGAGLNPAYNGLGLHVVAFPNNFTPTKSQ